MTVIREISMNVLGPLSRAFSIRCLFGHIPNIFGIILNNDVPGYIFKCVYIKDISKHLWKIQSLYQDPPIFYYLFRRSMLWLILMVLSTTARKWHARE